MININTFNILVRFDVCTKAPQELTENPTIIDLNATKGYPSATKNYPSATASIIVGISVAASGYASSGNSDRLRV